MPAQTDACLIYARMSMDSPLGVARQLEDCRALAAGEGWSVAGEYVDDGKSATNGKPRPDYLRLLADARAGKGSRVIAWDQDRLLRDPDERGPWVKLADAGRVAVYSAAGVELTADPFTFGVKALVAENEVRQMKKRLRRSLVQRAAAGKAHGRCAYGWSVPMIVVGEQRGQPKRVRVGADVIDPAAAAVIRESAAALLAGDSVYAVTRRLNAAGSTTAGGGQWTPRQLRSILLRPRNAGLTVHRGQVVSEGDWPPILDRGTHDRITALLTDPSRVTNG
ncbi:MAG TPA: recombinase family protein, partial [Nakamurella sp.]